MVRSSYSALHRRAGDVCRRCNRRDDLPAARAIGPVGGTGCFEGPCGEDARFISAGAQESMKKVPSARPVQLLTVDVPSPVIWLPATGIQNPMLLQHEARMFHT